MHRVALLLLVSLLLGATLPACAGSGAAHDPVGAPEDGAAREPAPVDPEVERWFRSVPKGGEGCLIPGDRVSLQVQGHPDLAVTRVLPADGSLPLYGSTRVVQAVGRTPDELEREVAAAYAEQYADPYVTVLVEEAAPRSIYIAGAVVEPRRFSLAGTERLTVLQAVTLAGGATADADLSSVRIMRLHPERGEVVASPPLDLRRVVDQGDLRDNLFVEPGDTVVVPTAAEMRVFVLGLVESPGAVRWYRGMTLSKAIAEAGGFKRFAKLDDIAVVRRGRGRIRFDFDALLDHEVEDLPLEPGDSVFVAERFI